MKNKPGSDDRSLNENERTAVEDPDTVDQNQESGRRKLLKALGGGSVLAAFGGILPDEWKSPVTEEIVDAIAPPAHAGIDTSSPGPVSTSTPSPSPSPTPTPVGPPPPDSEISNDGEAAAFCLALGHYSLKKFKRKDATADEWTVECYRDASETDAAKYKKKTGEAWHEEVGK